MTEIVFLDTETTSLSAENGQVWEFAGIKCDEKTGEEIARTWFQIECELGEADPFSLKIGKYRERFGLAGMWDPLAMFDDYGKLVQTTEFPQNGEVVDKFTAAILVEKFTRGTHIVGNVISFDSERLERMMRAHFECPGWHYHVIDIEPIIVGYARAKGTPFPLPYSSDELGAWLGVEGPSDELRHTAMGDADWVRRQWAAMFW